MNTTFSPGGCASGGVKGEGVPAEEGGGKGEAEGVKGTKAGGEEEEDKGGAEIAAGALLLLLGGAIRTLLGTGGGEEA